MRREFLFGEKERAELNENGLGAACLRLCVKDIPGSPVIAIEYDCTRRGLYREVQIK